MVNNICLSNLKTACPFPTPPPVGYLTHVWITYLLLQRNVSKSLEYTDAGYVVTEALSITLTLFNILDKETRQKQDKTL